MCGDVAGGVDDVENGYVPVVDAIEN